MVIILIMTLVAWLMFVDPEVQLNERIIPSIAELDIPLVMGSRPKKLNRAIQEAARVSCDRMREGPVGEEDALWTYIRGPFRRAVNIHPRVG